LMKVLLVLDLQLCSMILSIDKGGIGP